MPKRPQIRVGILITKDDQVLLMKRRSAHEDGTWSTVGGHLEYRESLQECAIRETQEVIGVIITDVTFLAITNDTFEVPEMHDVTIWMAGRYVSGEPAMHTGHEKSVIDWFCWDALPEPHDIGERPDATRNRCDRPGDFTHGGKINIAHYAATG